MPGVSLIIYSGAAYLLAAFANRVGLGEWQRNISAHWTERARLLWPARATAGINSIIIPIVIHSVHRLVSPETSAPWLFNGLAAFVGAQLAGYRLDRAVYPTLTFRQWRHNVISGWGFQFSFLLLCVVAGAWMPAEPGWGILIVTAAYLVLHFLVALEYHLKVLRWLGLLRPADARLQRIVNEASARANIPVRATWILTSVAPQALAFPAQHQLLFSDSLLELCDDEEVSVICAHELAHLTESRLTLAGRCLGSLVYFPLIYFGPAIHQFGPLGIFLPICGLVAINHFSQWLSQKMERRADDAATGAQTNEGLYARALEKLYEKNLLPAVNSKHQRTHPHLYDRMLAAGLTPAYDRPAPPESRTWPGQVYGIILGIIVGIALVMGVRGIGTQADSPSADTDPGQSLLYNDHLRLETQHLQFPVPAE